MKEKVNVTGVPETMKIREKFLTENGPVYQIAKSAMDASYTNEMEYSSENVLVIIEGLSMYLSEADVLQMMSIYEKDDSDISCDRKDSGSTEFFQ